MFRGEKYPELLKQSGQFALIERDVDAPADLVGDVGGFERGPHAEMGLNVRNGEHPKRLRAAGQAADEQGAGCEFVEQGGVGNPRADVLESLPG